MGLLVEPSRKIALWNSEGAVEGASGIDPDPVFNRSRQGVEATREGHVVAGVLCEFNSFFRAPLRKGARQPVMCHEQIWPQEVGCAMQIGPFLQFSHSCLVVCTAFGCQRAQQFRYDVRSWCVVSKSPDLFGTLRDPQGDPRPQSFTS